MDSQAHAGYIANPDSGRERGRKGLKVTQVAFFTGIVVFPGDDLDAVLELTKLDETQVDGEKKTRSQEQHYERWTPNDITHEFYVSVK